MPTGLATLDLYGMFVEQIFGGLLLTVVGLGVLYVIIMALGKLNTLTILSVLVFYIIIVGCMFSSITFFFVIVGTLFYFITSLIRFFSGGMN